MPIRLIDVIRDLARRPSLWPGRRELEDRVRAMRAHYFHMSLPQVHIQADGRLGDPVTEESDQLRIQIVENFIFDSRCSLQMLQMKLQMLREADIWSEKNLAELFASSQVMSRSTRAAVLIGVSDFEAKHFWSALHVLIPQVERTIREISQLLLVRTLTHKEGAGEMHWKTITQLLGDSSVCSAIDTLQPDFSWHVRSLLIDGAGPNIRDHMAHGITTDEEPIHLYATAAIFILIILSSYRVQPRGYVGGEKD